MDFIESIFSIVPLMMILLFIIRFAAGMKNKKKAAVEEEPEKSTDKRKPRTTAKTPAAGPQQDFGSLMAKLGGRHALTDIKEAVAADTGGSSAGNEEENNHAHPQVPQARHHQQSLNSLHTGMHKSRSSPAVSPQPVRPPRLENLPELKKAVVWAEILGKPKGLE